MSHIALDYAWLFLAFLVSLVVLWKRRSFSKHPYPPGPKGLLLIGNVRDIPPTDQWITYAEWSRKYNSDVIYLNLYGTHMLVANTPEATSDLFEKRPGLYSDKLRLPMIEELCGLDWAFGTFKYNKKWKAHRRLFNQHFNTSVVSRYEPQHIKAVHEFLYRLAQRPEDFMDHVFLMAGSLILNVAYGIDAQSLKDPHIVLIEKPVQILNIASTPGSFLVDSFPILKYVPEWFPGADFKKRAKEWRKPIQDAPKILFQFVRDQIANGIHTESFVSRCLEQLEEHDDGEAEETIRGVAATTYMAGANTTVSVIDSFFLAMVLHPEAFRKAREELDRVVGQDRLPEFSDKPVLPYISAIVNESLRWNPVAPFAVGHQLMTDDIYRGNLMPAGAIVIGNAWAILHDEKAYSNPEAFNPDRFLKDGKLDPDVRPPDAAFGFGPRMCPGRYLALDSMFITIASVLSTFDIGKAIDEDGKEITPSEDYTIGLSRYPVPFKCSIKPRSAQALSLIMDAYAMYHT